VSPLRRCGGQFRAYDIRVPGMKRAEDDPEEGAGRGGALTGSRGSLHGEGRTCVVGVAQIHRYHDAGQGRGGGLAATSRTLAAGP
jgi:hypothetical protein